MHTTNTFVGLGGDIISTNKQIKKLSLLTNYSDSGDNISISSIRSLDRYLYESLQKDNERFKLLFDTESNLKLIWQFGYFSFFFNQDIMLLELKYKQHAEDFQRINTFQQEGGFIAKKEALKVYLLFKLFCLQD